jgi:hypothetical protein
MRHRAASGREEERIEAELSMRKNSLKDINAVGKNDQKRPVSGARAHQSRSPQFYFFLSGFYGT